MSGGTAARVAWGLWALCVLTAVPTLVLVAIGPGRVPPSDIFAGLGGVAFLILALTFASVGAIVAWRRPENAIGWIFCVVGLATCLQLLTWQYADVGLHSHRLPGTTAAAVFNSVIGEATAGLLALPLLLFPDGRLPSRRWRPVLAGLLAGMALLVIAGTLRPGTYSEPFARVTNPFGVHGARAATDAVDLGGWVLVIAGLGLAAAAMVVRLRRAAGVERKQLKLVLAVGSTAAAIAALLMTTWLVWPSGGLQTRMAVIGICLATIPAAAGLAILRYRLYEIDLIIRRTLVYGVVTAGLAGLYFAIVLLLQEVFSSFAGGSDLAIAGSTLAVAALFRPVRTRVQALVDRRFYRRRYDTQETLGGFSARLRDEIDLDALHAELLTVVDETMRPAGVSLWLRGDR
jgi:hypothetical protein